MKKYYVFLYLICLCGLAIGCGEERADPRANPDFNEEAYNDPNAAMKAMGGANAPRK